MQYAEDNNIIVPEQNEFRHGHSRETQLLGLADELTQNLQLGKKSRLKGLHQGKPQPTPPQQAGHYGITGRVNT